MHKTARGGAPWTAVVGLILLWAALVAVGYFTITFTLLYTGTAETIAPLELLGIVAPSVAVLALLVCATLRVRWARWVVVVLGIGLGVLGLLVLLVTLSPSPTTVAMSLAAIVGGVLLALPASSGWFTPVGTAAAAAR